MCRVGSHIVDDHHRRHADHHAVAVTAQHDVVTIRGGVARGGHIHRVVGRIIIVHITRHSRGRMGVESIGAHIAARVVQHQQGKVADAVIFEQSVEINDIPARMPGHVASIDQLCRVGGQPSCGGRGFVGVHQVDVIVTGGTGGEGTAVEGDGMEGVGTAQLGSEIHLLRITIIIKTVRRQIGGGGSATADADVTTGNAAGGECGEQGVTHAIVARHIQAHIIVRQRIQTGEEELVSLRGLCLPAVQTLYRILDIEEVADIRQVAGLPSEKGCRARSGSHLQVGGQTAARNHIHLYIVQIYIVGEKVGGFEGDVAAGIGVARQIDDKVIPSVVVGKLAAADAFHGHEGGNVARVGHQAHLDVAVRRGGLEQLEAHLERAEVNGRVGSGKHRIGRRVGVGVHIQAMMARVVVLLHIGHTVQRRAFQPAVGHHIGAIADAFKVLDIRQCIIRQTVGDK